MKIKLMLLGLLVLGVLVVPPGDTAVDVVIGSGGVGAVNGVSYPANPAVDTVPTVTATNTVSYRAIPDCDDSIGQHLNYDTTNHQWICGNSTRTVPAFTILTSPTSIGVNSDTFNEVRVSEMNNPPNTAPVNLDAPTGSPFEGQRLTYTLYSTVSRTLTYTTTSGGFAGEAGLNLPTKTIAGSYLILEFRWSAQSARWALVSVSDRRPKVTPFDLTASGSSVTINTNTTELATIALGASAQTTYTVNLAGTATPYDGQVLRVRFTTTAGAPAKPLIWDAAMTNNAGIDLPTTTTGGGKEDAFGFQYNAAAPGTWVFLGSSQGNLNVRRRTCMIVIGADNGAGLSDADLGPQLDVCMIPSVATIEEVTIKSDGGTPAALPQRRTSAGVATNLLSGALATAGSGGLACARPTAVAGYAGTTCVATLTTISLAAGDWLGLTSGSASTAKRVSVAISYLLSN